MRADAPILVFDSGVGGLTVLQPIRRLLPQARFVYAADNAGFPYGTKSEAEIAARVPALLGRLVERFRPRLVVIACNTASTIALAPVRAALDVPVVGTVPAIKPAAALSVTRTIGVLGTEATVRQLYVDRLVEEFASDCIVLRHGSAALVDLAEAQLRGEAPDPEAVRRAVAPLLVAPGGVRMDVAVLACTHFPLLADALHEALPGVKLVDGADGIARRVATLTQGSPWPSGRSDDVALFTRDDPALPAYAAGLARYGLCRQSLL